MSIESGAAVYLLGVGIWYAINQNHQNNLATLEKRRDIYQERMEKIREQIRKRRDKIRFITKFIDEIPELSYYEATQLKNKLGNIYLEWNDE
jgi:membrane protein DedA with SNARE-associated domain